MASLMDITIEILKDPVGIVYIPQNEGDTEHALEIELPAYYEWIWLLSYDETIYASTSYDIMRIDDLLNRENTISGVTMVPYRTATRIRGDLSKRVFLRGNGRVQIVAQNSESCPFGVGSHGF